MLRVLLIGASEFKNTLIAKDFLDDRLMNKVIAVLDIAYGGTNGLTQAISLSQQSCLVI